MPLLTFSKMLSEDLLSEANSRVCWQNFRKLSSLATKSVSQLTSTKRVSESIFFERIIPSTAVLEDFFSAFKTLFFLKFVNLSDEIESIREALPKTNSKTKIKNLLSD